MKVSDVEKLKIDQAILDGLSDYNKTFAGMDKSIETIVDETRDKIVRVLEK